MVSGTFGPFHDPECLCWGSDVEELLLSGKVALDSMLPFVVDEAANVGRVAFVKLETRLDVHPVLKGVVNKKGTTEFACRQSVPVASIA